MSQDAHIDIASKRCGARRQRGLALLIVLATLGLLAVVAASFTQIARSHIRVAAVASEGAKAEALADAGIEIVLLDLIGARESTPTARRFALDATPLSCTPDEGAILTLAVQDEAGKVDLNITTPQLLRALVLGLGLSGGEAAVDAILDYRDEDDDRRISGAERREYLAAGRPNGPRNGPFIAVEELANVLGLTQADVDRLRPFVTIYSGLTAIDASVAPKALVDVLAKGLDEGGGPSLPQVDLGFSDMSGFGRQTGGLPPQFFAASTRRAFSVRSQARMPTGATFVREAVIEFVSTRASAVQLRRWFRASAIVSGASPSAESLPPC